MDRTLSFRTARDYIDRLIRMTFSNDSSKPYPKYSFLISFYFADNADFLKAAVESCIQQSIPPKEIILVQDGPVDDILRQTASGLIERHFPVVELITLAENVGLGAALDVGLSRVSTEFVARMDADDICLPDRIRMQLDYLLDNPSTCALGGFVAEFCSNVDECGFVRLAPIGGNSYIRRYSKFRNPMNHQTVFFRKSSIERFGGYSTCFLFEDYWLWARILNSGGEMSNIPQILVKMRVCGVHQRRRGLGYLKNEVNFYKKMLLAKYISWFEFLIITGLRLPLRLLPMPLFKLIYQRFLRVSYANFASSIKRE